MGTSSIGIYSDFLSKLGGVLDIAVLDIVDLDIMKGNFVRDNPAMSQRARDTEMKIQQLRRFDDECLKINSILEPLKSPM